MTFPIMIHFLGVLKRIFCPVQCSEVNSFLRNNFCYMCYQKKWFDGKKQNACIMAYYFRPHTLFHQMEKGKDFFSNIHALGGIQVLRHHVFDSFMPTHPL